MAEATTPLHSAPSGKRDRGRGTPTGQTAQRPMKRVSLREKEPPSRPCSITVASRTENSLEKPASAHVRMGSRLRSRISLAGGRRLLQSHNKTHNVRPIVLYMTYGNSGCGLETHTARGTDHTPRSHKSRLEL